MRVACPECGADVARAARRRRAAVGRVVARAAAEALAEVAELAAAFGWSEAEVLALTPLRRARVPRARAGWAVTGFFARMADRAAGREAPLAAAAARALRGGAGAGERLVEEVERLAAPVAHAEEPGRPADRARRRARPAEPRRDYPRLRAHARGRARRTSAGAGPRAPVAYHAPSPRPAAATTRRAPTAARRASRGPPTGRAPCPRDRRARSRRPRSARRRRRAEAGERPPADRRRPRHSPPARRRRRRARGSRARSGAGAGPRRPAARARRARARGPRRREPRRAPGRRPSRRLRPARRQDPPAPGTVAVRATPAAVAAPDAPRPGRRRGRARRGPAVHLHIDRVVVTRAPPPAPPAPAPPPRAPRRTVDHAAYLARRRERP